MAGSDEDLQEQVNNAVSGEADNATDNGQGSADNGASSEDDVTDDSATDTQGDGADAGGGTAGEAEDADEEEDDDDDDLAPFQVSPQQTGKDVPEDFDIRTLPRDENGLIDPVAANKAIQDWAEARAAQRLAGVETEGKAREVLTNQWNKAKEKYPFLSQNKDLAGLTRDLHLSSITAAQNGTGRYLSPLAAAKKVNKMYARAVKSGVRQMKTRTTVERTATTETSTGKGGSPVQSEYAEAKKMASSKDPRVAAEGRRKVMAIRYKARNSS